MTCSKRKLITPERKPPSNIQEAVAGKRFNVNNDFTFLCTTHLLMTLRAIGHQHPHSLSASQHGRRRRHFPLAFFFLHTAFHSHCRSTYANVTLTNIRRHAYQHETSPKTQTENHPTSTTKKSSSDSYYPFHSPSIHVRHIWNPSAV